MNKLKSGTVYTVLLGIIAGWLSTSALIRHFDSDLFIFLSIFWAMLITMAFWYMKTKNKIAGCGVILLSIGTPLYFLLHPYLNRLSSFCVMAVIMMVTFACLVIAGGQVLADKDDKF